MTGTDIPQQAGKVSLAHLQDMPEQAYSAGALSAEVPGRFWFDDKGFRFDLLWRPNPGHRRLFVFFSGDAMRSRNDPPVFQRWSWGPHFPGHCLYFSDPSLYLHPRLGLAWYAGTQKYDPLPAIARTIREICLAQDIPLSRVFSYGSSGGGFAALRLLSMLPDIGAIAINAQTNVTRYEKKNTERYLDICFAKRDRVQALKDYPQRLSLFVHVPVLLGRRIIYIQNEMDTHHYDIHYRPFCGAMGSDAEANETEGPFRRLLFAHEGGHTKAETPEVFGKALDIVRSFEP
jgi:hypothetical protein